MVKNICIVGLGYVGLPLAIEFGKKRNVIGFDHNDDRIKELKKGYDSNLESSNQDLKEAVHLTYTSNFDEVIECSIYIVTVPTPIDKFKKPDLSYLKDATSLIASKLKIGDIVIYESTVYPGATEEICVPILEKISNLTFNRDFFCGYSPERVNPGDRQHRVINIKKITSGSTPEVATEVDDLYNEIILAGTYKASNLKVAEAAKVIENTQRDVNIALINELSIIFNLMDIDTEEVLMAASTKWNFISFKPGLVGGHCIGVDPYYLTYKALKLGYDPEIILAGRRINDNMGSYVVDEIKKLMTSKDINIVGSNILILGLTFKENCPDIRNTKIVDLVANFLDLNCNTDVYDPWVDKDKAYNEYGIQLVEQPKTSYYDAIILAVAHDEFKKLSLDNFYEFGKDKFVLYDVKYLLKTDDVDGRL